jgi:DNA helicase-2/ATP-dependent DNA helicase PcrA
MDDKLLNKLNTEQLLAVKHDGPMLVLAGAGSGKTSTMTAKFIWLIQNNQINPNNILGLTFSNKAANEMKERVIKELEDEDIFFQHSDINIYTFHSFCARVLRIYSNKIGFKNNFIILDEKESSKLLENYIEENPKYLLNKNKLLTFFNAYYNNGTADKTDELFVHFQNYQLILKNKNCMDFGSLLLNTLEIFRLFPDIALSYENRYKTILVDEFQDTNKCQFEILRLLRITNDNICCVGDADQSIYSWRGAELENILSFEKTFKKSKTFKLQNNYRSTQKIVDIANNLIEKNIFRKEKTMFSKGNVGNSIFITEFPTPMYEARNIVQQIKNKYSYSESFAILYRNNALSRELEQELMNNNIGYNILGGFSFYERKEIKDIFSYLKLIYSNNDICFERIINTPKRGIGSSKIEEMKDYSINNNKTLYDTIKDPIFIEKSKFSKKVKEEIALFVSIIENCKSFDNLNLLYSYLMKSLNYEQFIKDNYDATESIEKLQNLNEFQNSLITIPNIETFLDTFSLDNNFVSKNKHKNNVFLSTIHACKGLEFDHVFVIGLEEDILPSKFSKDIGLKSIEEERRLFYVAITRAKQTLQISYNQKRLMYGREEMNLKSRFLKDIPSNKVIFKKI